MHFKFIALYFVSKGMFSLRYSLNIISKTIINYDKFIVMTLNISVYNFV